MGCKSEKDGITLNESNAIKLQLHVIEVYVYVELLLVYRGNRTENKTNISISVCSNTIIYIAINVIASS